MAHEFLLKDLLPLAFKAYNFDHSVDQQRVLQAYRLVVGEFIVTLTRSVIYNTEKSTLYVVLSSPALKNLLTYKTNDLRSAINNKLGDEVVKKIVFG
ncbi:MAG: DUF721 domain-containing protein [Bacteroidales bacterium]|nr:DUF721 domain-containing protein [Bacteroidales bacterium]